MDINLNVNVKFEETPALINCFSAFSTALQATVGALAMATTTSRTVDAEEAAPAKASRKSAKSAKAAPAMPAEDAPAVEPMPTTVATTTPETVPVQVIEVPAPVVDEAEKAYTLDDVKAICMDFIKKNPDKKAKLAESFQQVGATKLSDTPAEKYAELVQLVQAL
ncbi:hypothetical protein [uncultured Phascolarctobacterium sp.]|uniref:hypothetical protein n=1 Tax=uncultured Phascolarctobacterium sp. TaxID=512296 RepID=UPI0025E62F0D|nr:hypothetical protein [uncultured Phascolarctobacterium sp.]